MPCDQTTFEPKLFQADLSRVNLEPFVLSSSDQKKAELQVYMGKQKQVGGKHNQSLLLCFCVIVVVTSAFVDVAVATTQEDYYFEFTSNTSFPLKAKINYAAEITHRNVREYSQRDTAEMTQLIEAIRTVRQNFISTNNAMKSRDFFSTNNMLDVYNSDNLVPVSTF